MSYKKTILGQAILETTIPKKFLDEFISVYKTEGEKLKKANSQLAGKIKKEFQLYYYYKDTLNNVLSDEILNWYRFQFRTYLIMNKIQTMTIRLSSIWINEMFANEYNPVHIHQGMLFTGLSSVMILKLPSEYGEEYSSPEKPMNGRLQIIGAAAGQFAKTDYSPNMKLGDFYIFPYDMRHCVYPFNGTKEKRRTLVCNMDVNYDPVASRTASSSSE